MTALTASGWLWLGWCVFVVVATVVDMFRNVAASERAKTSLLALLSLAWLGWLVSP